MNTGTLPSGHALAPSHIEIRATVITTGDPRKIELVTSFIGEDGEGH